MPAAIEMSDLRAVGLRGSRLSWPTFDTPSEPAQERRGNHGRHQRHQQSECGWAGQASQDTDQEDAVQQIVLVGNIRDDSNERRCSRNSQRQADRDQRQPGSDEERLMNDPPSDRQASEERQQFGNPGTRHHFGRHKGHAEGEEMNDE